MGAIRSQSPLEDNLFKQLDKELLPITDTNHIKESWVSVLNL